MLLLDGGGFFLDSVRDRNLVMAVDRLLELFLAAGFLVGDSNTVVLARRDGILADGGGGFF